MLFVHAFNVYPNYRGFLYRDNVLDAELEPGRHVRREWSLRNPYQLHLLPMTERLTLIVNQEVLTKDSIALRFSFYFTWRVKDARRLMELYHEGTVGLTLHRVEQLLSNQLQLALRDRIVARASTELNEQRPQLTTGLAETLATQLGNEALEVLTVELRDLTFPKNIQELFARKLEAKIRAEADLENARTAVATARALKNAADLMQGDDNVRFFQYLEMLNKIASKGNHTFVIGEPPAGAHRKREG